MIRIPRQCKALGGAMQKLVDTFQKCCMDVSGGRAVEYERIEKNLAEASAGIERAAHGDILANMAVTHPRIEVSGKVYARAARGVGTYFTLAGPIEIERYLYRELGRRGGPTIDPIALRTGAVGDGWLPQTAAAMAHYVQALTSREAVECVAGTGRLPYCRSSFERVTHEVGSHYRRHAADIEDALIADYELPEGAASVSVSLDRTSLPMEESRERPPGRPKKGEPRNPVSREFRMAWCATVTIHDREGDALTTLRYGRMPKGDQIALCEALASDAEALLKKNPRLKFVTLADGAPDVLRLLDKHISRKRFGKPVRHLVEFWHVTEYLGADAKPIGGDDAPKLLARWKAWLRDDDNGVTKILGELRASGCADVRVGDNTPVADAIRYIFNHRRLMDYAAARRAHLPIGSGNVEATCTTLIGVRMKRCGSRWKEENGDDILRFRALAPSDRWQPAMQLTFAKLRTAVRRAA